MGSPRYTYWKKLGSPRYTYWKKLGSPRYTYWENWVHPGTRTGNNWVHPGTGRKSTRVHPGTWKKVVLERKFDESNKHRRHHEFCKPERGGGKGQWEFCGSEQTRGRRKEENVQVCVFCVGGEHPQPKREMQRGDWRVSPSSAPNHNEILQPSLQEERATSL